MARSSITRRHRRGFERAGALPRGELGLPAGRTRELQLALAWREIAGEAVARRAPALRVRRGVLEVEVREEAWRRTMLDVLPALAGRLAARHPDLRITRYRMISGQAGGAEPAQPVPSLPDRREPEPANSAGAAPPGDGGVRAPALDIREVMARYLARGGSHNP
jgi:hypothetical protein